MYGSRKGKSRKDQHPFGMGLVCNRPRCPGIRKTNGLDDCTGYNLVHTHIKELLALNTVHVPVFLHTRIQQLRVAPDEKYSGCMFTFANQIKTIKLFKYKNASKYSLFELSIPNNRTYIAHTGHFMSTPVFVALQPIKF